MARGTKQSTPFSKARYNNRNRFLARQNREQCCAAFGLNPRERRSQAYWQRAFLEGAHDNGELALLSGSAEALEKLGGSLLAVALPVVIDCKRLAFLHYSKHIK
jgi:hypothetical protein